MNKIAVLGCGWLGLPLAKAFIANGFSVNGSTTSLEKISFLENEGVSAFKVVIDENEIIGDINDFLGIATILIVNIPPKLRGIASSDKKEFVQKIENLIPYIENSLIEKVIFVSSTSVYLDNNQFVTEETLPIPKTESAKQLLIAEKLLQNNTNFKTTILRFGGLTGADRNPIYFLAGKNDLENPEAPINLIHQKDCIGIVLEIVNKHVWNETFNAVAPFHPTRADYYKQKAVHLNLPLPKFNLHSESIGKTISSRKIENFLHYKFKIIENL